MAGIVDGISALINPTNVIQAGGNALMMGFMTGNIANALPSAAMNLGMRGLSAAITPRPNTGNGIANALNTYSPPQQPTPQISKAENIGQVVQNIGETLISRVETTNALLQKLIDVQTGRSDDMDYRKKATQYGRMAQALSRSAMGRIFLTVMGNTIGRQSADLQYVTKGALQSGVTNAKEILTTRLLSELPGLSKYFKSKFDDLAKNILRIQTPYTKETDMTINKIIPNSLKSIGELMNSHLSEQTEHLSVISQMSIDIQSYAKKIDDKLTHVNSYIERIDKYLEKSIESQYAMNSNLYILNQNSIGFFTDTKHHYTEVERILERSYTLLSTTLPQLVAAVDQINTRSYIKSGKKDIDYNDYIHLKSVGKVPWLDKQGNWRGLNGDPQNAKLLNFIGHYLDNRYPLLNNKNETRKPNDYDKNVFRERLNIFLDRVNECHNNEVENIREELNNISKDLNNTTNDNNKVLQTTFQDVLKTLQEQQKTLEASTKDQSSLKDTVKQNDIRNQYLQNLSDTASSLLTNMVDLRSSFSMFSMNLPNLLTRSLSSIIKVGIGMFLGRQLIGLLYRVFTGSTNNIGKNGFIGTLWHEGIFSAIMYAKDKIAGYLGDALNWVFSAITGKESFKATVNEYYNKGKEKVWNYFLDSLPTLIKHVVERKKY